tara:strand:+ start:2093 stop:3868 length:1776 start_codon:yes stop_codon:yes gene_type:complete
MKQNDKSSFTGLILMAAILIIFNVFVFDNSSEQVDYKENTEQVNSNQQDSKEENIITTTSDIDTNEVLKEEFYVLENDKIKLEFTNKGGEISSAVIKGYYSYQEYKKNLDDKNYESKDIEIFNNKDSRFEITGDRNINTNEFFLVKEENNSISFRKNYDNNAYIKYTYTLDENKSYFVDLSIESEGISNPELIWTIAAPETEKSKSNQEQYTGFYYQEDYSKDVDYTWDNDAFELNEFNTEISWIAFKQQFFSTIITAQNNNFNNGTEFKVVNNEEDEYIKVMSLRTQIEDGESNYSLYLGPNDYNDLKSYDLGYENILPLGFMWIDTIVNKYIIIKLFNFLKNSAGLANFGIIILLLTLIIKFSLAPFTYKSYLSQAKMKVLKPEIDKINEKHKEKDPLKAQQESMNLYRKAGVNPMGGCLPMLFQFPILIAMFRFFPASLDLRQNAFLWADDLSAYDSIYKLGFEIPFYGDHISLFTLLMCISTLMYTHMNSQMSGNQMPGMKFMMYLMPVMFLGFFNNYASALSYYYFLANIFTFSQMFFMRRFVDEKAIIAQLEANKKKPRKKSKFQKKLEELQRKQEQQLKNRKKK